MNKNLKETADRAARATRGISASDFLEILLRVARSGPCLEVLSITVKEQKQKKPQKPRNWMLGKHLNRWERRQ